MNINKTKSVDVIMNISLPINDKILDCVASKKEHVCYK